jgi:hypothetical protein
MRVAAALSMRPISTRTHGIIDYIFSATLLTLPFALRWPARAAQLSVGAGLATLGVSLLTNYEYGLARLLPMKAHLGMDAAENSLLMSAPKIVGGEDRSAGRILAMMGTVGSAIGAMTKTRSPLELPA